MIGYLQRCIQLLEYGLACGLCHQYEEDISHVLFSCKVVQTIWWRWYGPLKIQMVSHAIAYDHFRPISHGLQGQKQNNWWLIWVELHCVKSMATKEQIYFRKTNTT